MGKNKSAWIYKIGGIILVYYGLIAGMWLINPAMSETTLKETWRNLFLHVPMWYVMMILFIFSLIHSIRYLNNEKEESDYKAANFAQVGVLFGLLGLITGSVWSRVTWGEGIPTSDLSAWWIFDPKQTSAMVLILIYLAYFLLRNSFDEPSQKAKVAAVYNIFAAAMIIPLLYILPKMLDGMHPGSKGEGPLAVLKDLNSLQRLVFYPVSLGFIFIGLWLAELRNRLKKIELITEDFES